MGFLKTPKNKKVEYTAPDANDYLTQIQLAAIPYLENMLKKSVEETAKYEAQLPAQQASWDKQKQKYQSYLKGDLHKKPSGYKVGDFAGAFSPGGGSNSQPGDSGGQTSNTGGYPTSPGQYTGSTGPGTYTFGTHIVPDPIHTPNADGGTTTQNMDGGHFATTSVVDPGPPVQQPVQFAEEKIDMEGMWKKYQDASKKYSSAATYAERKKYGDERAAIYTEMFKQKQLHPTQDPHNRMPYKNEADFAAIIGNIDSMHQSQYQQDRANEMKTHYAQFKNDIAKAKTLEEANAVVEKYSKKPYSFSDLSEEEQRNVRNLEADAMDYATHFLKNSNIGQNSFVATENPSLKISLADERKNYNAALTKFAAAKTYEEKKAASGKILDSAEKMHQAAGDDPEALKNLPFRQDQYDAWKTKFQDDIIAPALSKLGGVQYTRDRAKEIEAGIRAAKTPEELGNYRKQYEKEILPYAQSANSDNLLQSASYQIGKSLQEASGRVTNAPEPSKGPGLAAGSGGSSDDVLTKLKSNWSEKPDASDVVQSQQGQQQNDFAVMKKYLVEKEGMTPQEADEYFAEAVAPNETALEVLKKKAGVSATPQKTGGQDEYTPYVYKEGDHRGQAGPSSRAPHFDPAMYPLDIGEEPFIATSIDRAETKEDLDLMVNTYNQKWGAYGKKIDPQRLAAAYKKVGSSAPEQGTAGSTQGASATPRNPYDPITGSYSNLEPGANAQQTLANGGVLNPQTPLDIENLKADGWVQTSSGTWYNQANGYMYDPKNNGMTQVDAANRPQIETQILPGQTQGGYAGNQDASVTQLHDDETGWSDYYTNTTQEIKDIQDQATADVQSQTPGANEGGTGVYSDPNEEIYNNPDWTKPNTAGDYGGQLVLSNPEEEELFKQIQLNLLKDNSAYRAIDKSMADISTQMGKAKNYAPDILAAGAQTADETTLFDKLKERINFDQNGQYRTDLYEGMADPLRRDFARNKETALSDLASRGLNTSTIVNDVSAPMQREQEALLTDLSHKAGATAEEMKQAQIRDAISNFVTANANVNNRRLDAGKGAAAAEIDFGNLYKDMAGAYAGLGTARLAAPMGIMDSIGNLNKNKENRTIFNMQSLQNEWDKRNNRYLQQQQMPQTLFTGQNPAMNTAANIGLAQYAQNNATASQNNTNWGNILAGVGNLIKGGGF